ncbi:MAG: hypothetical protein ACE5KA_04045 [Nitrososphaerales archaeon]
MFGNKGLDQKEEENQTREQKVWVSWEAEAIVLKKQWEKILANKLKLNEKQFFYSIDFLEKYGMIDATDSTILKIQVPFAICRKDDFVCIEIPYKNDGQTETVQHIIRILDR